MAALLKLITPDMTRADLPMALHADAWSAAPEAGRAKANALMALLNGVADDLPVMLVAQGLREKILAGLQGLEEFLALAHCAARAGWIKQAENGAQVASLVTMRRAIAAYRQDGRQGLLPQHTGRVRQLYGWEAKAIEMYARPSKPSYVGVAKQLRYEYDFESATDSRVVRYLKALPTRLGAQGPKRVGPHLHRLTMQKFQARHTDNLRAGDCYVGDGHTIDCYVAHPNTGKLWRPELSFFLDLKSRLPVGWWLGNSENVIDTLRALGNAIGRFEHVPPMLYLDHGAGYRAKIMSAEGVGFASQMGIDIMAAIPGNPHGKGWVENFFHRIRDEHDKFFNEGQTYCGDDMADETNRRISADVKSGKRKLPNFYDYKASLAKYLERVSHEAWPVLQGQTPAALWAESFVRVPSVLSVAELIRPVEECTVARQMVTLHKRTYVHKALIDFQGILVRVRYDLHEDDKVWVCDQKDRLICIAELTKKVAAIPTSRIEQAREVAELKAVQRKQYQIEEIRARALGAIDAQSQLSDIASLDAPSASSEPRLIAGTESLAERRARMQRSAELLDGDVSDVASKAITPTAPEAPAADEDIDLNSFNPDF